MNITKSESILNNQSFILHITVCLTWPLLQVISQKMEETINNIPQSFQNYKIFWPGHRLFRYVYEYIVLLGLSAGLLW
jgi:hypothetical protein